MKVQAIFIQNNISKDKKGKSDLVAGSSFINSRCHKKSLNFTGVNFENVKDAIKKSPYAFHNIKEGAIDVCKSFDNKLNDIKMGTQEKIEKVNGWFKEYKINKLKKEENLKIKGFLAAQELFSEEQDKVIELYKSQLKLLTELNASEEECAAVKAKLLMEQKVKEKMDLISKNKSQKMGFNSIGGYDVEKFILTNEFINQLPKEMAGQNVKIPNGILFFGPFANGKTTFAEAFANSAGCHFVSIRGKGKTPAERQKSFLAQLIKAAEDAQTKFTDSDGGNIRTIILADEFDDVANDYSIILAELKKFMQSCSEDYHCTIFATSNNPLGINSALRTSKRLNIKVNIDPPNKPNAMAIFEHYLNDKTTEIIDYEVLADKLLTKSGNKAYNNSQIENICNECYKKTEGKISQKDVEYYIEKEEPSLTEEELAKYNTAVDKLITKMES